MESANLIKIKKANSHTYRRLRKIAALMFRFLELFLFIMVVSRFTTRLPVAFRISADYFTGLSLSLFRPGSVFLIGNAIILLLFLISGSFSAAGKQSSDYYEDYVKRDHKISSFQDKLKIIKEPERPDVEKEPKQYHHHQHEYEERTKIIQRSQSENKIVLGRGGDHREEKRPRGRLSRSLTETCRKAGRSREDEMSSEEFQQTVEDFIARQQRLLREELFGCDFS